MGVVARGAIGATVTPACACGAVPGNGTFGPAGAAARPEAGTVEAGPLTAWVVLVVVVPMTDEPASSSLTTSSWATTGAGRSVTSAATSDVAAHTMAVDATVAASHSPTANNRCSPTAPRMPLPAAPSAKGTLNLTRVGLNVGPVPSSECLNAQVRELSIPLAHLRFLDDCGYERNEFEDQRLSEAAEALERRAEERRRWSERRSQEASTDDADVHDGNECAGDIDEEDANLVGDSA